MELESKKIKQLRLEHGWSQERLAKISGLSLRTIQRIEAGGSCSVESRLSLASTFDITPNALLSKTPTNIEKNRLDISRFLSLSVIIFVVIFLCYITGGFKIFFDAISLVTLLLVAFSLSILSKSLGEVCSALILLKWHIFAPTYEDNLPSRIRTLQKLIAHLYASSIFISLIALLGVIAQEDVTSKNIMQYLSIAGLPMLYALGICELLIRPIKFKAEILLCIDNE